MIIESAALGEETPEIVLTPDFTAALDELLDRRERRASARTTRLIDTFKVEEDTSRPQYQQVSPSTSQPRSVATLGTRMTMVLPPDVVTKKEIE